jgi:hypothetical protein
MHQRNNAYHLVDWTGPEQEASILKTFDLQLSNAFQKPTRKSPSSTIPDRWEPPPVGFIKLNFDGASKGNLGSVGLGGAFQNDKGELLRIYVGSLGIDSNNAAELQALLILWMLWSLVFLFFYLQGQSYQALTLSRSHIIGNLYFCFRYFGYSL